MELPDKVSTQIALDARLNEIFAKYFEYEKNKDNAGYLAWANLAAATGISLMNLLLSLRKPDSGRGFRAVQDLAYALNYNDFWVRNSAFLMPLVITAINAQKDFAILHTEAETIRDVALVDKVMCSAECVGLELFPAILYLVGGPDLMTQYSVPLKLDLLPYLVG